MITCVIVIRRPIVRYKIQTILLCKRMRLKTQSRQEAWWRMSLCKWEAIERGRGTIGKTGRERLQLCRWWSYTPSGKVWKQSISGQNHASQMTIQPRYHMLLKWFNKASASLRCWSNSVSQSFSMWVGLPTRTSTVRKASKFIYATSLRDCWCHSWSVLHLCWFQGSISLKIIRPLQWSLIKTESLTLSGTFSCTGSKWCRMCGRSSAGSGFCLHCLSTVWSIIHWLHGLREDKRRFQ